MDLRDVGIILVATQVDHQILRGDRGGRNRPVGGRYVFRGGGGGSVGRSGRRGEDQRIPCGEHVTADEVEDPGGVPLKQRREEVLINAAVAITVHGRSGDRKSTRLNSSHVAISYA